MFDITMKDLFDIKGRVVVMTGACGVLGETIVKYFAAQGAKVVLMDLARAAETGKRKRKTRVTARTWS